MSGAFLLAYFLDEHREDGEAIRFAVSDTDEPYHWIPLADGQPILQSHTGEQGTRDPFLVRLPDGEVVLLATDLRVWPDQDWDRATRFGSRSILVSRSRDLIRWTPLDQVTVAPDTAGNTWAPKAFWSAEHQTWRLFWASGLYPLHDDRQVAAYQRILVASTSDFRTFGPAEVYLDRGRDVIDATFLEHDGDWYRFTVDQRVPGGTPDLGHHPFEEIGTGLDDPQYRPLTDDLGKHVLQRGEGPAIASSPHRDRWYLLIDEFGLRGYQLFETNNLPSGQWQHRPGTNLPAGARHGSLLPISGSEQRALLAAFPAAPR